MWAGLLVDLVRVDYAVEVSYSTHLRSIKTDTPDERLVSLHLQGNGKFL